MAEPAAVILNWYATPASDAVRDLQVDARVGLESAEAAQRLQRYGPNRLA
jgi:hypothetical protein